MSALDSGRYSVAAGCVGICQGSLDASVAYAKEREQFGRPIASLPARAGDDRRHARADRRGADARLARGLPEGPGPPVHDRDVDRQALRDRGGAVRARTWRSRSTAASGYVDDHPVERYFRDVRVTTLYEGTSQIQKLIIGRAETGHQRARPVAVTVARRRSAPARWAPASRSSPPRRARATLAARPRPGRARARRGSRAARKRLRRRSGRRGCRAARRELADARRRRRRDRGGARSRSSSSASCSARVAEVVRDDCVLATNTSSLPVTADRRRRAGPERVVGMHFFNPAPVMKLVEVIAGERSGEAGARARARARARRWAST